MKNHTRKRFIIIIIIVALVFSILVIRITKLMFFQKDLLQSMPQISHNRERGFIVDRKGEKLALSLETYSVYARPGEIEHKKEAARKLAEILEIPYEKILKTINMKKPFVWIQRQTDFKYTTELQELNIKGIYIEKEFKRHYPFKSLGCHIIGFSGIDQKGLEGIEYQFDNFLLPEKTGTKDTQLSSYNQGYTVVLTIDRWVQEIIEEELKKAYRQTGAKYISAIIMHPASGEILALANEPVYDLNNFNNYSEEIIRNKALTDAFEPGSTFKIFIASILLDRGLISEDDSVSCTGAVDVEGVTIHDSRVHGTINFRQVLEKSCNVGMVESVKRINKLDLFESLRAFGFGTLTGINLPGEAKGILRNPKDWSRISRHEIAIGQEVSMTALQLITAASAIANKGVLMQPRIVKRLEKPDGSTFKVYKPLKIRRPIGESTASEILDILIGVLSDEGTGYKARIEGYTIAGKTGTAQIADTEKGGYLEGQFYASFIGFIPVPDPKIVLLVTLDRPVGESYGGQTAAPIFRNIIERIAPYFNILPSFSEIYILKNAE